MEHVEVLRHMKETIRAIMPSEVAALDAAIAALSAPQPPAEAQAQGGGEVELRHMVAKLAAHVRPTCGELWAEAERLLNRTAPPSAPVGVEDGPIDASDNAEYIEYCADRLERCGLRVTAGALRVIAQEHRALAQQGGSSDD